MQKSSWITIGIIIAVLLIAFTIIYFKNKPHDDVDEEVVKCIAQKAILYVQLGCPKCKAQEDLFGENLKYINITDCWYDQAACEIAGITQIPTWFINNEYSIGKKTIEELKTLTGC